MPETVQHVCSKEHDIEEIKKGISEIKKLLLGNGVIGVAEMSRRSFEWVEDFKKSRSGLLDWAFRACITIILGFIAVKVGLK